MHFGTMFNAYPDSLGDSLKDTVEFLSLDELKDAFRSFYILPSVFNSDLDRGFSVISYDLNRAMADREDLDRLRSMGIDLTFDFILNHLSVLSPPNFRMSCKTGIIARTGISSLIGTHFGKNAENLAKTA